MGLVPSLARPAVGPCTHGKLGPAALPCPEPLDYTVGNIGWVEFLLSLPKQDKEELMMQVGMYPTEWDLPKQEEKELMMLLGMSAREWEKAAREARERLAKAQQARLRLII